MRTPVMPTCIVAGIVCGTILLTLVACGGGGSASPETSRPPEPPEPGEPTDPADVDTSVAALSLVGEYRTVPVGDAGGAVTAEFHRWGVWGGIPREDAATCTAIGCPPAGDTVLLAYLNHDRGGTVTATVDGIRSGTSPQAGSAFWVGDVLGYARGEVADGDGGSVATYAAVRGDARLAADLEAATVDIDFTGFDDGRSDLSWHGLAVEAGEFGDGGGSIEGSFYGADHEGAAGVFSRARLAGVFGALRAWPVEPGEPGTGATGGVSIEWGPRLGSSGLSALSAGNDEFGPAAAGGLAAAARSAPAVAVNGVSQSSLADQAVGGMRAQVVRDDDGNLVYELTDGGRMVVRVPSPLPRLGFGVAVFSDLIPGVEPDLSSYPHDVLGMWAWGGAAGAFWSRSPEIPGVRSTGISPAGRATYEGDAVGVHAAGGSATKFLADVEMVADFGGRTVGGRVDGFHTFSGKSLGALSVTLGETAFLQPVGGSGGSASIEMAGRTGSGSTAGSGLWGARWSDGDGWTMGGTFGFAADDGSVSVLGAFTACSCASAAGGDPDDPVSTGP